MRSQVRSKSKCLTIWRFWFSHALPPYRMEISQCNYMYRVWDTSKHDPKVSVRIFKVKVTRSRKGQIKTCMFGTRYTYMVQVSFSSRTRKMIIKHYLNGQNRMNFENRENVEIPRISVKNGHFDLLQNVISWSFFQDIGLKFCTHIHLIVFFHIYSIFEKSDFSRFLNNIFIDYFPKFAKLSKF